MTHTADPRPPRFDRAWLLFGVVPLAVLLAAPRPALADVLGFRIEARACRGEVCRDLPRSSRLMGGRYACQGRAARLQDLAASMPPSAFGLPTGREPWRVTVRCIDVVGMAGA